jgi:site-specific recombinase XerD
MIPENAARASRQRPELTPENTVLLAEYEKHLARAPLSGHTPRTYLGAVSAYLAWLERAAVDGDPLNDATAKDWAVRDYRSYLVTVAKRATATVNKHLAALQDFYTWRGLGRPEGVKRHQVPRHAPKALEPRAKLRYLRAVEACPSARDRAIALLPLYAGTRIAEIRALDVADVRLSARKGELHLVGKGEKSRTVPVHQKLREALAAWIAERPSRPGAASAALFTSVRGTRMTTDAIADVIEAITRAAGLDDHVTSHVLRHTFGTELTRDGVDLVTVAELMGHASLETTRLYTRPTTADMQRAVDLLSADD